MDKYKNRQTINNLWASAGAALIMALGMFFGYKITSGLGEGGRFNFPFQYRQSDKLDRIIELINRKYVDSVDLKSLELSAIDEIIKHLDPHSAYISASEYKRINAKLEGRENGIGIEFRMMHDTMLVTKVIDGGPAVEAGLAAGDRIVRMDSVQVSGQDRSSSELVALVNGPMGSEIQLDILRHGKAQIQTFNVTRGRVPVKSIETAFMITDDIGYLKLNKFAASTHKEFLLTMDKLKKAGMKKLIFDLRNNGGGYLAAAIALADEFLAKNKLIVYTEGENRPKEEYYATAAGLMEQGALVVLINEGSASASEVLAGALQDFERATLVGRRSFGKGLVQTQTLLPDGSALRLTVARYYTPLGRSIQKPYKNGVEAYYHELYKRWETGELYSVDSMRNAFPDSLKVSTASGKVLYGGGGIMPDFFVPIDTMGVTNLYRSLYANDLIYEFSYEYIAGHIDTLLAFKDVEGFVDNFKLTESDFEVLLKRASENALAINREQLSESIPLLKTQIKAIIAQRFWGDNGFYRLMNNRDAGIQKALRIIKEQ